jgi:hypothetical protein
MFFAPLVKFLLSATTLYAETQNAEYNLRMWLCHTPLFGGVKIAQQWTNVQNCSYEVISVNEAITFYLHET